MVLDVGGFKAAWEACAAAQDPDSSTLGGAVTLATQLPLPGGTLAHDYLGALEGLLAAPGGELVADQYSFELFPSVARLLSAAEPGSEQAVLATRCASALARMCSAREIGDSPQSSSPAARQWSHSGARGGPCSAHHAGEAGSLRARDTRAVRGGDAPGAPACPRDNQRAPTRARRPAVGLAGPQLPQVPLSAAQELPVTPQLFGLRARPRV
jgi:hypothetical protein